MNASQAVEAETQDGISTTIDIALASEGPKSWLRRTASFLVTTTYSLDDIDQGYADMEAGKNLRGVILYD